jgi:hypothetical protein
MFARAALTLVVVAFISAARSVNADLVARTTISFNSINLSGNLFDSLVFDWSTPVMSGQISDDDLTSLTFRIFTGATLVYEDVAIAGGTTQPIAGVARNASDVEFHFDIDTMSLIDGPGDVRSWDNDNDALAQMSVGAVGTTWHFATGSTTNVELPAFSIYMDGNFINSVQAESFSASTVAIPEPFALLYGGLISALAGCACAVSRIDSMGNLFQRHGPSLE